jgi:hypothetical protein
MCAVRPPEPQLYKNIVLLYFRLMRNPLYEREVGVSDCRTTTGRMSTHGATTCVILAALNTETKTGLVGHFLSWGDEELFKESLEAVTNLGPCASTLIRLAGGGIYFSDGYTYPNLHERNKEVEAQVLVLAEAHGIPRSSVEVSWLWGNDIASATVDCNDKTITIEEELDDSSPIKDY